MDVYAPERQREIVALARATGRVGVRGLAESFDVAHETVRRDLVALAQAGLVRRVHGGAVLTPSTGPDLGPEERERLDEGARRAERERRRTGAWARIAARAVQELPDGGSVLLDSGGATARLAELLPGDRAFTVVTPALPVAALLAGRPNVTLHVLGGVVRPRTLATAGERAREELGTVFADVAVIGADGVCPRDGVTTADAEEAAMGRALVGRSRRTLVLADSTVVGRRAAAPVCGLAEVDVVVTDAGLPDEVAAALAASGPTVVRA